MQSSRVEPHISNIARIECTPSHHTTLVDEKTGCFDTNSKQKKPRWLRMIVQASGKN
jgi:predicted RNA-binding protein with PUA-like domain